MDGQIDTRCRSFVWTGSCGVSRKSPIAWRKVCKPKHQGGLNIFDLEIWKQTHLAKMLWNISKKKDNLWVQWIHAYYIKNEELMSMTCKPNYSWVMNYIVQVSKKLHTNSVWEQLLHQDKFNMKRLYRSFVEDGQGVSWKNLFVSNLARPRAQFVMWMACHSRLATRDRLRKYGMEVDSTCCFCTRDESIQHLFFGCDTLKSIWRKVLTWIRIRHEPAEWDEELEWLCRKGKSKSWKSMLLKLAATETVYTVWKHRNETIFKKESKTRNIENDIIENIVYRGWSRIKMRKHLAKRMMM